MSAYTSNVMYKMAEMRVVQYVMCVYCLLVTIQTVVPVVISVGCDSRGYKLNVIT